VAWNDLGWELNSVAAEPGIWTTDLGVVDLKFVLADPWFIFPSAALSRLTEGFLEGQDVTATEAAS
jgi:hypothetical protein